MLSVGDLFPLSSLILFIIIMSTAMIDFKLVIIRYPIYESVLFIYCPAPLAC